MPTFFVEKSQIQQGFVTIQGKDAAHITKSLRMSIGEGITVCDGQGSDYDCILTAVSPEKVVGRIRQQGDSEGEPTVAVHVYVALSKGDKMDYVVQKVTELGAFAVHPFISERCVSKPDSKAIEKKTQRWQKIMSEAAKQCGRGKIPTVYPAVPFSEAIRQAAETDMPLFLYENEQKHGIKEILSQKSFETVSVVIGPEGGFAEHEVSQALEQGMQCVSIGKRILRCETAPLAAVACVMYHSDNF